MDKKLEFLLNLYDIEQYKKSLYSSDILSNKPKLGKEKQFEITVENIAILDELIDERISGKEGK